MARSTTLDPDQFLPLKPSVLAILVSLEDAPRHGYAIIQAVRERSGGAIALDTGPLYRYLKRLLDDGLVEEVTDNSAVEDPRRRCYRPTTMGQQVLAAEMARLDYLLRGRRRAAPARSGR